MLKLPLVYKTIPTYNLVAVNVDCIEYILTTKGARMQGPHITCQIKNCQYLMSFNA